MTGTLRALLALLLGGGLVVSVALPAAACSCAAWQGDAAHLASADAAVTGVLVDRYEPVRGPVRSTGDPVVLTVEVDEVLKGEARELERVATAAEGASCGLELPMGEPVLLFLQSTDGPAGARYAANLCGGSRTLAEGPVGVALRADVVAPQPGGSAPADWVRPALAAAGGTVLAVALVLLSRRRRTG